MIRYLRHIRITKIEATMNEENGRIQENTAEEKGGDTHPPVPVMQTAESGEERPKGTEQSNGPASLHEVSRMNRLKEWASKITIAEAGMLLLTIAIAWSSIVYTKYAKRQWRAMGESNQLNRESLTSVQRAFVVFQGTQTIGVVVRDKTGEHLNIIFSAQLENTGTTPGNGIMQHFNGKQLPNEPSEQQFADGGGTRAFIVGPHSPYSVGRLTKPMSDLLPNVPNDVSSIRSQDFLGDRQYFWGWISYRDVFPKTAVHITEWCQVLDAIAGQPQNSGVGGPKLSFNFHFDNCQRHNCADEECEDYAQIAALRN